MMNFIVMTLSFTVALVLAGVIMTTAMFALMLNGKAVTWFMKVYLKSLEKSMNELDKLFKEDLGA